MVGSKQILVKWVCLLIFGLLTFLNFNLFLESLSLGSLNTKIVQSGWFIILPFHHMVQFSNRFSETDFNIEDTNVVVQRWVCSPQIYRKQHLSLHINKILLFTKFNLAWAQGLKHGAPSVDQSQLVSTNNLWEQILILNPWDYGEII